MIGSSNVVGNLDCAECGHTFQVAVTEQGVGDRVQTEIKVKCPKCGHENTIIIDNDTK